MESGLGGDEATLCNGATAIVSGGNEEVKVMHPENQGQLDPTPHKILTTESGLKISRQSHKTHINVMVSKSQVKGNSAGSWAFESTL